MQRHVVSPSVFLFLGHHDGDQEGSLSFRKSGKQEEGDQVRHFNMSISMLHDLDRSVLLVVVNKTRQKV